MFDATYGVIQWRRNEFESGGHRSGAKVGAQIRRKAPEIFFGRAPPLFGSQLVVLVSVFVVVSTIWSVSYFLFFYSRCPRVSHL